MVGATGAGAGMSARRVCITGAAGYVGRLVGARLARDATVLGVDLHPRSDLPFETIGMDVRDPGLGALLRSRRITHVVHLASVLEASGDPRRDFDIDVNGTRNVVEACLAGRVGHLTVASSGAAYGYHADNPAWLDEEHPLRATPRFAYAHHKRLVEELLAGYRASHPALGQLVLRICTVLGATTDNQITALFARRRLLAVRGSDSPFVFIWDEDLAEVIARGVLGARTGTYNVAGDGALTVRELAAILGKGVRTVPAWALAGALAVGRAVGASRYGPEQVDFLRWRPVLANRRLKESFGYAPAKSSEEAFRFFVAHARARRAL
jgi:UDP-glucose 4-epimerase